MPCHPGTGTYKMTGISSILFSQSWFVGYTLFKKIYIRLLMEGENEKPTVKKNVLRIMLDRIDHCLFICTW